MKLVPRSERIFLTGPRIEKKHLSAFMKLDVDPSGTRAYKYYYPKLTVGKATPGSARRNCPGPKNIQANTGERWADEEMISSEISHLLSLGRTPQSSACNIVVNGSGHASLAANHPEPGCAISSFSKEAPLMFGLYMVVSHKQQPYMVFPSNDNRVFFI